MNKTIVVLFALFMIGGSCGKTDSGGDGGLSSACYIADMWRCEEAPTPTTAQAMHVTVLCSSSSGVPSSPAACPTAAFQGKCVESAAAAGMDGPYVIRYYTGADVAYAQDFCVNTAHGTWSTTF